MSPSRVLVVDDETNVRNSLARALGGHGYEVGIAGDGRAALAALGADAFDAVLLDLMMPGIDGFEVLRQLHERSQVPVIVLSARGDESDKIRALDLGADDYVTKPFGIGELLARLRVVLRRVAEPSEQVVAVGDVTIDLERQIVTRDGTLIHLSPIEFTILAAVVERRGVTVKYPELLEAVWGRPVAAPKEEALRLQALRVHINALRRKLEPDPKSPRLILTEPGRGYRLWSGN